MFKTELLSPAGNMETLISACNNGADAIYVGGKSFGARAFANNFSLNELKEAVDYCHLYGVKLYVTANTVVFEQEIKDFLDYMKYLYEIGIDAVIMQDLGMINLVKKLIPNLEIHASTQINCHNDEGLYLLQKMGVKRVVLPRELSLQEINAFKCSIQKEIFIHGALCVSYSGQCLFSSLNGGRSGNRGMCAGSCRLPYELYDNGKVKTNGQYLLSTKDLCTINNIKDILDSHIDSLKIEGRMKSPEYVGYVTRIYRRLIDDYYMGKEPCVTAEEEQSLKILFNREFTKGYLFNDDVYNIKTPNHIGASLGKVIKISKKYITIKLTDNLYQEDGIRFCESSKGMIANRLYNEKGLLVNKISKGSVAIIDNKVNLNSKDTVNKTTSKYLANSINRVNAKKIPISFKLNALMDSFLEIAITDGVNTVTEKGILLSKAKNKPTTYDEIYSKLNRLGSTPFYLDKLEINLDDVFIPMSVLNDMRRILCDKLIYKRTNCQKKVYFSYKKALIQNGKASTSFLVRNEKQLKFLLGKGRIYTEDYNLYKKYKKQNVFYKLPRIMKKFPDFHNENLLVSELGSLYKYSKDNFIVADYPLNITNSETVNFLHSLGVKISTISPEVTDFELEKYCYLTEKIIYGKLDLMILKKFRKDGTYLKNRLKYSFPIIHGDYITILHHKNLILNGFKGRIILFDETKKEIKNLLLELNI